MLAFSTVSTNLSLFRHWHHEHCRPYGSSSHIATPLKIIWNQFKYLIIPIWFGDQDWYGGPILFQIETTRLWRPYHLSSVFADLFVFSSSPVPSCLLRIICSLGKNGFCEGYSILLGYHLDKSAQGFFRHIYAYFVNDNNDPQDTGMFTVGNQGPFFIETVGAVHLPGHVPVYDNQGEVITHSLSNVI